MLKEKYFCSFFITSLRLCTHYFVWTPVSNLPLKTILSIHYQIKTEGNRNILPVPISLHNNTCTYPKVKPKWLSSYTSINPFTRCIQTLFSRASHPTANAVLSTLRFNFLASSGIDILFTSLRRRAIHYRHWHLQFFCPYVLHLNIYIQLIITRQIYLDERIQKTTDSPKGNRYPMIHRLCYKPTYQLCIRNFFSVEFQCLTMLFR